ncbi:hypothetical protein L1887_28148 [Cichorium endivia]|nr:hypothetical protein L1887_28148 [Cichorium endivia]
MIVSPNMEFSGDLWIRYLQRCHASVAKRDNGVVRRRPFSRDEKVEVRMQEGEFAGAVYGGVIKSCACRLCISSTSASEDFADGFYERIITKTWKRRCEVQLRCLPDNTTGKMMIVRVKYGFLCPIPPTVVVEYKVGDYVDAWDRQGWWCGVVDEVIGDDVYDVVLLGAKSV